MGFLMSKGSLHADAESFFTLSLDMLCIASMDGYFLRVNPAFEQVLGHPAEELVRRPFVDFVHPDDRADTIAEVAKLSMRTTSGRISSSSAQPAALCSYKRCRRSSSAQPSGLA